MAQSIRQPTKVKWRNRRKTKTTVKTSISFQIVRGSEVKGSYHKPLHDILTQNGRGSAINRLQISINAINTAIREALMSVIQRQWKPLCQDHVADAEHPKSFYGR